MRAFGAPEPQMDDKMRAFGVPEPKMLNKIGVFGYPELQYILLVELGFCLLCGHPNNSPGGLFCRVSNFDTLQAPKQRPWWTSLQSVKI